MPFCTWLARMLKAGEDPRFIARRIVIHAAEDVGLADPMALVVGRGSSTGCGTYRDARGEDCF